MYDGDCNRIEIGFVKQVLNVNTILEITIDYS